MSHADVDVIHIDLGLDDAMDEDMGAAGTEAAWAAQAALQAAGLQAGMAGVGAEQGAVEDGDVLPEAGATTKKQSVSWDHMTGAEKRQRRILAVSAINNALAAMDKQAGRLPVPRSHRPRTRPTQQHVTRRAERPRLPLHITSMAARRTLAIKSPAGATTLPATVAGRGARPGQLQAAAKPRVTGLAHVYMRTIRADHFPEDYWENDFGLGEGAGMGSAVAGRLAEQAAAAQQQDRLKQVAAAAQLQQQALAAQQQRRQVGAGPVGVTAAVGQGAVLSAPATAGPTQVPPAVAHGALAGGMEAAGPAVAAGRAGEDEAIVLDFEEGEEEEEDGGEMVDLPPPSPGDWEDI